MNKYLQDYEKWVIAVNEKESKLLESLRGNETLIKERFHKALEFGTAGMRGEVDLGIAKMNIYTVKRATHGLAQFISSKGEQAKARGVVIAYDTRRMSYEFALAAAEVLSANGVKGYIFEDVRPVPLCSFAVRSLNAYAGIMITASHNPKEYNGFKVYGEDGAQMGLEDTKAVVHFIEKNQDYFSIPSNELKVTHRLKGLDFKPLDMYITVIGKTIDEEYYAKIKELALSPNEVKKYGATLKLVYTPIHGSGYKPVTEILKRLGINVTLVEEQCNYDSEFSTVSVPNPENKDTLSMGIKKGEAIGADVVMGTDPDGDRIGVAVKDDKGTFISLTGNQIGILLLEYILRRLSEEEKLPANSAIVKTIVTSTLTDIIADKYNVKVYDVLTGFKFIGEKIKQWEQDNSHTYIFGFEESFGSLRGTHARDKDAVVAAMLFAEMVCFYESIGESIYSHLISIYEEFGYYTENNISISYKGVEAMQDMEKVMENVRASHLKEIAGYKVLYKIDYLNGTKTYSDGSTQKVNLPSTNAIYYGLENKEFLCLRPSGTEPKLKIYALSSGNNLEESVKKADILVNTLKEKL